MRHEALYLDCARPSFNSAARLLASLAALLAGLGIYGVISYSVAQRTREIGVRIALGAQRGDVLRLVLKQGLKLILNGIVIGLVAAFLLSRLMESLLFGISAADPPTFIVVSLLLIVVALLSLATSRPPRECALIRWSRSEYE